MKGKFVEIVLCVVIFGSLAACTSNLSASSNMSDQSAISNQGLTSDDIPLSNQLLLGIFKVEGSAMAVTADQATELLPLWKAVKSLIGSDTTSSVELDALYQQIQDTLTNDQLTAINGFTFDAESIAATLDEMGVGTGTGSGPASNETNSNEFQPMPSDIGGAVGMGSPEIAAPGNTADEANATERSAQGGTDEGMLASMIEPLIALLEERAIN